MAHEQRAPLRSEGIKPHLSASQLGCFQRCPEQYRRRYIEGERIPPGIAAHKGSGVHGGAQYNFQQKIESHEDLPLKDIVEVAITAFEKRLNSDDVILSAEEISVGKKIIVGKAKDSVSRMTKVGVDDVYHKYQPVIVEQRQKILLPSASHDIVCILDLADDQDRIVDFKTGTKKKPKGTADSSDQLTIQALTFKANTGRMPKDIILECLIDKAKPENQTLTTTRSRDHFGAVTARMNVMLASVNAGIFPAANPDDWGCSERWCGFFNTCPYTKGRR